MTVQMYMCKLPSRVIKVITLIVKIIISKIKSSNTRWHFDTWEMNKKYNKAEKVTVWRRRMEKDKEKDWEGEKRNRDGKS